MKSDESTSKEYSDEEGEKMPEYDYNKALQRKMWKTNKNSKFSNFVQDVLSKDRITIINSETVVLNKQNHSAQNGFLPRAAPARKAEADLMCDDRDDLPNQADAHGPEIINGVESEEVEEVNDAYNDLRNELGLSKDTEGDYEELVPSCGPLLLLEYLLYKVDNLCSRAFTAVSPGMNR